MKLPLLQPAAVLDIGARPLYVTGLGWESRGEQWLKLQPDNRLVGGRSVLFDYYPAKNRSRKRHLRKELDRVGITSIQTITVDVTKILVLEQMIAESLERSFDDCSEIIVDIDGMNKLLILLSIAKLRRYEGKVRIIYTELTEYVPTRAQFQDAFAKGISISTPFPSRGIESVVRAPALSSIRMQGQPITLLAFTSFNEQLVRHVVAGVSPHRLVLIGGVPPRLAWREMATQKIHENVINEYRLNNPVDKNGRLVNRVSTLYYEETYRLILQLYQQWGSYERIVAAATGSKMQTLGLALAKQVLPDIHIEYPTPRSYYVKEKSYCPIAQIYQVEFTKFSDTVDILRRSALNFDPCLYAKVV